MTRLSASTTCGWGKRSWHFQLIPRPAKGSGTTVTSPSVCSYCSSWWPPLVAVIPSVVHLQGVPELHAGDADAGSLKAFRTRWYKILVGDCSDAIVTTVCSDKWKTGFINSFWVAILATLLAVAARHARRAGPEPPAHALPQGDHGSIDLPADRSVDHHCRRHGAVLCKA